MRRLDLMRTLFIFCLMMLSAQVVSSQVLDIQKLQGSVEPWAQLAYVEDPSHQWYLPYLLDPRSQVLWRQDLTQTPNFGITDANYWFRLALQNSGEAQTIFVEISYPLLDSIDFYWVENNQVQQRWQTGDHRSFWQRPLEHRYFVLPLTINQAEQGDLYIRVQTGTAMQVPIRIWQKDAFYQAEQQNLLAHGCYLGIMLVMLLYNLFLYVSVRDKAYLYYVSYVFFISIFQLSLHGFLFQYLWPDDVWLNEKSIAFSIPSSMLFACLFANKFLQIRQVMPRFSRWIVAVAMADGVCTVLSLFLPYHWTLILIVLLCFPTSLTGLTAGVLMWMRRERAAAFYTLSWLGVIGGALILPLSRLGWLPRNLWTENSLQIGSALEVILLSLALAQRINAERKAKLFAQAQALLVERRATDLLERRVTERTAQLQEALESLSQANVKLKEMSETDGLTGVFNRRYFDQRYDMEWRRSMREKQPLSLLLIDVDWFKSVNDQYGHLVGDEALKRIAQCILQSIRRPCDMVARYGGEEFIVILANTHEDGAHQVAQSIAHGVNQLNFCHQDQLVALSVSIGVASKMPALNDDKLAFIQRTDQALYQAKQEGRNRCVVV